jgi:hypothetical protein
VQEVECLFEGHRLERKKHAVGALLSMLSHPQNVQLRVELLSGGCHNYWIAIRFYLIAIKFIRIPIKFFRFDGHPNSLDTHTLNWMPMQL